MLKAVGILWTLSQVIGVEDVCTYSAWVLVSYIVLQAKCNPPPAPPPSTLQAPQFNTVIRYTMLLAIFCPRYRYTFHAPRGNKKRQHPQLLNFEIKSPNVVGQRGGQRGAQARKCRPTHLFFCLLADSRHTHSCMRHMLILCNFSHRSLLQHCAVPRNTIVCHQRLFAALAQNCTATAAALSPAAPFLSASQTTPRPTKRTITQHNSSGGRQILPRHRHAPGPQSAICGA
jgi:hypothetical protein